MEPIDVLALIFKALAGTGVRPELDCEEEVIIFYPDPTDPKQPWCIDAGSLTELRRDD